jgi:hypothetical protein
LEGLAATEVLLPVTVLSAAAGDREVVLFSRAVRRVFVL